MIKDWSDDEITGVSAFIVSGGLLGAWWTFYYRHYQVLYDVDHLGLLLLTGLSVIWSAIAGIMVIGSIFDSIRHHQRSKENRKENGKEGGSSKLPWLIALAGIAYFTYKNYYH